MPTCAVKGCKNRRDRGNKIKLYRFPKNENTAKEWIKICKNDINIKKATICAIHFDESCFNKKPINEIFLNTTMRSYKDLEEDAIPTKCIFKEKPGNMAKVTKVLISDAVDTKCVKILEQNGIEVVFNPKMTKEELLNTLDDSFDALIVRSATQVTEEVLKKASGLKVVGRAGAGVDNINVKAATARKVLVLNTPGGNAVSACEMTCGLMMAMARNIPQAAASMKEGRWDRTKYAGSELSEKVLAVLGLGRVGREVALRMNAFGMKVVGYDPIVSTEQCKEYKTEKLELEQIWPIADYITIHTPLMESTRNLINGAVLDKCKKGVKIINVGRGGLIDENALLSNLDNGKVGAAALDVFEEEPPKKEITLKLIKHPKVVATPHLGASTKEAQIRVAVDVAQQFVALNTNDKSVEICSVNPDVLKS